MTSIAHYVELHSLCHNMMSYMSRCACSGVQCPVRNAPGVTCAPVVAGCNDKKCLGRVFCPNAADCGAWQGKSEQHLLAACSAVTPPVACSPSRQHPLVLLHVAVYMQRHLAPHCI